MTTLPNLTTNEKQVLKSLINRLYAEAGFSDVDASELSLDTKISTKSIRGVISSLIKKRIIFVHGDGNFIYEFVYLKQDYYGLVPNWAKQLNIQPIEII